MVVAIATVCFFVLLGCLLFIMWKTRILMHGTHDLQPSASPSFV